MCPIDGASTGSWTAERSVDWGRGSQEDADPPTRLKPTTKVGTLGPYRGRLGLAWVIAPLVAGVIILVAGYFALYR